MHARAFCFFLLFLLMILFYSESASFFAVFVLVARGRFINPFNEIKIKQKMGKKKVVLQVHTFEDENKTKVLCKPVKLRLAEDPGGADAHHLKLRLAPTPSVAPVT